MQREDVPALATAAGASLVARLSPLPGVVEVRGLGLLIAVEVDPSQLGGADAKVLAAALLDQGVVVNAVTPTALRLAPSLLISAEEIDEAVARIGAVLSAAAALSTEASA